MKEREISLVDLIFDILLHWRTIVVAMLVGMLLLGSFSYVSSYRTSKAQEARVESAKQQLEQEMQAALEQSEAVDEANKEALKAAEQEKLDKIAQVSKKWLEERLTDLQRYNVNYVFTYEELYREKVAYVEDSVLMQIDPNSVKRAEITFLVTSGNRERTYNLVKLYEDFVRSGELFALLADDVGISTSDVNEIVSLEKESYSLQDGVDTIRVRINHYDEEVCEKLVQVIIDYMTAKCSELSNVIGNHEISILTQSLVTVSDTNIMSQQRSYFGDIATLESAIANYKSKFSEIEWQYYDFLINGELTELSISKMSTASISESKTADTATEEEKGESLTDIINKGVTVNPGVSVKHVVLGAILAAFIYVFVVFVLYVLNGKLRITDNLQTIYSIPQLAIISRSEENNKFLGFVDEWIIALRDRNKRKFNRDEAIALAATTVKMSAEKDALRNIYLAGCDLNDQALSVCDQMKSILSNDGITVEILNNILYDAQNMSKLQDAQGVVLVEKAGSTLYTEIEQELELLKRQNIKVFGGIIVE